MNSDNDRLTLRSDTVLLPLESKIPDLFLPFELQIQHKRYNTIESSSKKEPGQPASQPSRFRWKHLYQAANDRWILESLACVGSFAALLGIIVVLIVYNGRSLPNWPFGITINSIMAWFTTAMKALMLVAISACIGQAKWTNFHSRTHALADLAIYDSATRGPQGSLNLLWKFQARHVACIGALITVLAMGIDPLVQQVVSVETRNVVSRYSPTLGRAQSFLQWDEDLDSRSPNVPLTFEMLGAMYSGIFTDSGGPENPNRVSFAMNPSCPTGNCTYPIFQSLAVCHHCANITDTLEGKCQEEPGSILCIGSKCQEEPGSTLCEYSLPNGLKLNTTYMGEEGGLGPMATSGYLGLVNGTNFGNTILNFTRITRPSRDALYVDDARNVAADECLLYWCVNTYEAKVTNGELDEKVINSFHSESTEWHQNAQRDNNIWLELNAPSIYNHSDTSRFPIAYLATNPLSDWLAAKMSLSNSEAITLIPNGYSSSLDVTANQSSDALDTMRVLWQPDIDNVFSNLAASMTRNIREVDWVTQTYGDHFLEPAKGAGTANGTAWDLEVYIHVRWPWLILPASLVVLTILFLILTVIETAQSKVEVWKSSPIPLLFHGLKDSEAMRLRWAARLAEMEDMAEDILVRLEETDVGWTLVGRDLTKHSSG